MNRIPHRSILLFCATASLIGSLSSCRKITNKKRVDIYEKFDDAPHWTGGYTQSGRLMLNAFQESYAVDRDTAVYYFGDGAANDAPVRLDFSMKYKAYLDVFTSAKAYIVYGGRHFECYIPNTVIVDGESKEHKLSMVYKDNGFFRASLSRSPSRDITYDSFDAANNSDAYIMIVLSAGGPDGFHGASLEIDWIKLKVW